MRMEDKEIRFWTSVDMIPNNLEDESKWPEMVADYHERLRIAKEEGIEREIEALDDIFKHLEVSDLNDVIDSGNLPIDVFIISIVGDENMLISRKWDEPLCHIDDIFKYEAEAIERNKHYRLADIENEDDKYEQYLDYIMERKVLTGDTMTMVFSEVEDVEIVITKKDNLGSLLKEREKTVVLTKEEPKKKKKMSESDDSDDDNVVEEEDDNGDLVRSDDKILLDDDFDDTYAEAPDGYVSGVVENIEEEEVDEEPKDKWNF
jgi:hypothetical protein